MKYTNAASQATALSAGMTKVKEYPDQTDGITCVCAITRQAWQARNE
jgi:hypothetical protein